MLNMLRNLAVFALLLGFTAAFAAESPTTPLNENFLTIADIHFDPFLSCGKTSPCKLIDTLRAAPAKDWAGILAKADNTMPRYGEDSNYPLLTSTLNAAKNIAATQHVKYVIVLGDFLGHDYRSDYNHFSSDKSSASYRQFVLKTMQFVSMQLAATFPNIDVYSTIGNNDSYGGDYVTNADGHFFRDMTSVFSKLIVSKENRARMLKSFPNAGYYSVILSKPLNLRLIVINSNLFSYKAQGKNTDKSANAQLAWVHAQLEDAKKQNQKVFIAMHIPVGIDVYASLRVKLFTLMELWKTQYLNRFQDELKAYAPQVAAVLAGHLHSDWFQVLTFNNSQEIPVTGTPSVSPIFGNNPGFKVYNYSLGTKALQDFATYYYPLNTQHAWTEEYDFNHVYQANCPGCPIIKGMELIEGTGQLAEKYKTFYSVGTSNQPIVDKWYPYYWCAIRQVNAQGYKECVN